MYHRHEPTTGTGQSARQHSQTAPSRPRGASSTSGCKPPAGVCRALAPWICLPIWASPWRSCRWAGRVFGQEQRRALAASRTTFSISTVRRWASLKPRRMGHSPGPNSRLGAMPSAPTASSAALGSLPSARRASCSNPTATRRTSRISRIPGRGPARCSTSPARRRSRNGTPAGMARCASGCGTGCRWTNRGCGPRNRTPSERWRRRCGVAISGRSSRWPPAPARRSRR